MKTVLESEQTEAILSRKKPSLLVDTLCSSPAFLRLKTLLHSSEALLSAISVPVSGLHGSLVSLLAAGLAADMKVPVMVLCSPTSFELYEHDLDALYPANGLCNLSDELSRSIGSLVRGDARMLLARFDEQQQPLCSRSEARNRMFRLERGTEVGYEVLKTFLTRHDFERREFVEDEGEYSVRGSIIDVFPYGFSEPVRIEFFGDTVHSLRSFDSNSQLSGHQFDHVDLTARFFADPAEPSAESAAIFDYLDPASIILLDDTTEYDAAGLDASLGRQLARFRCVMHRPFMAESIDFGAVAQKKMGGNFRILATLLNQRHTEERQMIFATSSRREVSELADFLAAEQQQQQEGFLPEMAWIPLNLYAGFCFDTLDLYTESDIFGKLHAHKSHRKRKFRGISLKDLQKLKVGDYVVHEDYGIGIFKSLETITVGNSEQESVLVEYEGGDQLYVNVQNIRLLSKYTASEQSLPSLSKLGSTKWSSKKEKVRKKIRDIAINLIQVYAQRKMQPGFSFAPDSIFMREFESAFIFDETPDQLRAIEDVKRDMQAAHPMERLICGDAGFGKTEIAMRAAFKAVESCKQVAILTPTTILAHQHAESFMRRFENFPITIAVLSRFVPRKEQLELIRRIADQRVDIVIGTHRLVSKDVRFKELGLLVIDEEQHFGVEVKEKLREQFPGVDTLTMSATPIPRTLQFSMLGARDLSIVSTPPKNRQPVETVVTEFDAGLIQSAILSEIRRGGQVFFLHNRIVSLDDILQTLKELVPSARIVYAHGQLPARELERIMMDFMQQEIDVLISTSIIGSGLDISNANTIIINRADMFGLSDLYQLRGRVGRSDRKAYCYLITPPLRTLKSEAMQRLAVIESFTELGSGFNIALRDLDIRGAGNLLGAEQSGYIHELGFDLYQKMLEETVAELKATEFSGMFQSDGAAVEPSLGSCDLLFYFDALIPEYYLSAIHERFAFYEKISKAANNGQLEEIQSELRDRFGMLPEEVTNLLLLSRLKLQGRSLGIEKIDIQPQAIIFSLPDQQHHEHLVKQSFFQHLIVSIQDAWMQQYKPGFSIRKKLELTLHHPEDADHTPAALMERYMALLERIDREAMEQEAAP